MVEMYFRNGQNVEAVWQFSVQESWDEFREQFPNNLVVYVHFSNILKFSFKKPKEV